MNKVILSMALILFNNAPGFCQDVLKVTGGSVITVQKNAIFSVNGGIVLDDKSTFKNEGLVTIATTGNITANFTDNTVTSYIYGPGNFLFSGNGAQTFKSVNQFERIDVNDAGLNLASNIKSNIWFLKTGKVNTGSFIAIATSTATGAVQPDISNPKFASSWVNGKLRRYINPATVNNYSFPVGDGAKANVAEMDNLTAYPLTGVAYVTVSFDPKPGNDIGLNVVESGAAYNSVNSGGVWYITPNALPGSGKYDLKLFFNGFTGLSDNKFGILGRPEASYNASDWKVPVNSALPAAGALGRTVAAGYTRRNNISIFNQFGIGTTSAVPSAQQSDYVNNSLLNNAAKTNFDSEPKCNVYPNPVTGETVFVDFSNITLKGIKLFTMDGRQIVCSYHSSGKNQLRVAIPASVTRGTYVLQLLGDERTLNTRIIIR